MPQVNITLNGKAVKVAPGMSVHELACIAYPGISEEHANNLTTTWSSTDGRSGSPRLGEVPPLQEGSRIYMVHTGNA